MKRLHRGKESLKAIGTQPNGLAPSLHVHEAGRPVLPVPEQACEQGSTSGLDFLLPTSVGWTPLDLLFEGDSPTRMTNSHHSTVFSDTPGRRGSPNSSSPDFHAPQQNIETVQGSLLPEVPPANLQANSADNSRNPDATVPSPTSPRAAQQAGWDCSKEADLLQRLERNPGTLSRKKTEQNRKAQARFRQRRQVRLKTMEKELEDTTAKLSQIMSEKDAFEHKAALLQQVVDRQETQLVSSRLQQKANSATEVLVESFWEMVTELKRGDPGLAYTRDHVADMVKALLDWQSPDLGFIRREVVSQLAESLRQGGDMECSTASQWLGRLISAYNKMVHKCGEANPFAFRTFLSLNLLEQAGVSVSSNFWRKVVEAGTLTIWQTQQLAAAHQQLLDKMQKLLDRRDAAGLTDAYSASATPRQPLHLSTMEQAKQLMDHQEHVLREEQTAVLSFRTSIILALEPIQQAKLMIASFPYALDTLAICSVIAESQGASAVSIAEKDFLFNLASNSPFQALASNSLPSHSYNMVGIEVGAGSLG